MSVARLLILLTAIFEGILGVPFLGASIIIGFLYLPLLIMFVLHIVTLLFAGQEHKPKAGSILGIVTSCIAWIPFVGMLMHIATAIVLIVSFAGSDDSQRPVRY